MAGTPVVRQSGLHGIEVAFVAAHGRPAQLVGRTVLLIGATWHVVRLAGVVVTPVSVFFGGFTASAAALPASPPATAPATPPTTAPTGRQSTCGCTCSSAARGGTYAGTHGVCAWLIGNGVTVGIVCNPT